MRCAKNLLLLGMTLSVCTGQSFYRKHNFTFDAGASLPRADLKNLFADSVALGGSYGYRFHPWFQVDAGLNTVLGAARVKDFITTGFGDLRIRDYQIFIPFGGRVVVPLADEKINLYAGGGGTYMHYTERIRQPFADSGFTFDCSVCSSRNGWGYYSILGGSIALDSNRNFRLGAGARFLRGHTEGDSFGNVPAVRTRDEWLQIFASFTFAF